MDKTIFISAYRNVSIRYILYSNILNELKRNGFKIVIFLKDNDLVYYQKKINDDNIILEPVLFDEAYKLLRSGRINLMLLLIRRCMSGGTKDFINTTNDVYFYLHGRELSKSLKSAIRFKFIKIVAKIGNKIRLVRKSLIFLESWLSPGNLYDKYFQKYNPTMLITSSIGYMIDPYFMRAAKRHGSKVVSIVHSWDNPTTKDYRGADPDHVIAWNGIMKKEINVFHDIPDNRIFVGGIAHWDFYFDGTFLPKPKDDFLQFHGLSKKRKILFYGTSGPKNFPRSFDVIEELLKKIKNGSFRDSVQLLVRLHPAYLVKEKGDKGQVVERFQEKMTLFKERYKDLVVFNIPMMKFINDDIDMPVEDMYNLADILHHADVMLTEYSTLMIEGAIFNLPIINVAVHQYRDTEKPASYFETFTHIKRIIETGACKNAYNMGQLLELINYYLEDPSRDVSQRKQLVEQEVTANKGLAGVTIGKYLTNLMKE
jgi:hypothetical protein